MNKRFALAYRIALTTLEKQQGKLDPSKHLEETLVSDPQHLFTQKEHIQQLLKDESERDRDKDKTVGFEKIKNQVSKQKGFGELSNLSKFMLETSENGKRIEKRKLKKEKF